MKIIVNHPKSFRIAQQDTQADRNPEHPNKGKCPLGNPWTFQMPSKRFPFWSMEKSLLNWVNTFSQIYNSFIAANIIFDGSLLRNSSIHHNNFIVPLQVFTSFRKLSHIMLKPIHNYIRIFANKSETSFRISSLTPSRFDVVVFDRHKYINY